MGPHCIITYRMSIKDLAELRRREQELLELNNQLDMQRTDLGTQMRNITSAKDKGGQGSRDPEPDQSQGEYFEGSPDEDGYGQDGDQGSDWENGEGDQDRYSEDGDYDQSENQDKFPEEVSGPKTYGLGPGRVPSGKKNAPKGVDELGGDMIKKIDSIKSGESIQKLKDYDELKMEMLEKERIVHEQNMIIDEIRENYEDLKQELRTKDAQLSELQSKGNKISDESGKFLKQIKDISEK